MLLRRAKSCLAALRQGKERFLDRGAPSGVGLDAVILYQP